MFVADGGEAGRSQSRPGLAAVDLVLTGEKIRYLVKAILSSTSPSKASQNPSCFT